MIRENRYLVVKRKDICSYLTKAEESQLALLTEKVAKGRKLDGKQDLNCVVVESDWPEFEPVWKMIENRVKALSEYNNYRGQKLEAPIVGSLVKPKDERHPLTSGCGIYSFAVVVSTNPFVLVSELGDMRWQSTVQMEDFEPFGFAEDKIFMGCLRRINS